MSLFRIFGAGEWGLAVANHLASLGSTVEVYIRDEKKINFYKTHSLHKDLAINFNNNISFHHINMIHDTKTKANVINIIATSSSGFLPIIKNNINYFKSCESLSWITKGLDHASGLLFHQILDQMLSNEIHKCIISGPSFAVDLVNKKNLEVSIASTDNSLMDIFMSAMCTDYFKLIPTKDIIGVEVSGVLKNISAILAGSLTANEFSNEYIDELILISQKEVQRISKLIGDSHSRYTLSDKEILKTLTSPACMGDLHLTCFYNTSRNRQLGLKLTKDCNVNKLITRIGTVEGYLSTVTLFKNKDIYGDGPLVNAAYDILYNHLEPKKVLDSLFV